MRCLITGGAGFIGTNLTRHLLSRGDEVIVFDNLSRRGVEWNMRHTLEGLEEHVKRYHFIHGDIRSDFSRLPKLLPDLPNHGLGGGVDKYPDVIIHLAANSGVPWSIDAPVYDFESNAQGTLNVLEWSRTHGRIPVVYASTNKVYSDALNELLVVQSDFRYDYAEGGAAYQHGINETFPVDGQGHPHSPYGCSKYTGDIYCQEYSAVYNVPTAILRMSCQYGCYQMGCEDQGWVAWFIRAHILGLPVKIYGDGKQVRDLLYADDLVRLYETVARSLASLGVGSLLNGNVYNVGGGPERSASLLEVLRMLDEIGKPFKRTALPVTYHDWRPADYKVFICDISKVKPLWQPTISVREGLERVYRWSLDHADVLASL